MPMRTGTVCVIYLYAWHWNRHTSIYYSRHEKGISHIRWAEAFKQQITNCFYNIDSTLISTMSLTGDGLGSALSLTPSARVPVDQLPPAIRKDIDHGWAWVVMVAACVGNMIVNGVCYTAGVYFVEVLDEFQDSRAHTAWVGSILNAQTCFAGTYKPRDTNCA